MEQNPVVFAMSPSYSVIALAVLLLLAWFVVTRLTRRRAVARRALWAGGIPRLLPQMTYTATGFSNPVRVVFQAIFQPNITEDTRQTVAVHFRTAIHRQREETHVVDLSLIHIYPRRAEAAPGISPGRPVNTEFQTSGEAQSAASICPVDAIIAHGRSAFVDLGKCVHCQRCRLSIPSPMNWDPGYEWTRLPAEQSECATLPSAFSKSMHIMVVDAGDCGACLHEVKQLNNPLYNMHLSLIHI